MFSQIFTILTILTTTYQVSIKDSWRPVSSPWEAARFKELISRLTPQPMSTSIIRSSRIAGGEVAKLGQFPYYAFLYNIDTFGDSYVCGSSIISHNWLLTAAHCLDDILKTSVYVGVVDRIQGPAVWTIDVAPKDFIMHENYSGITNDIALIRLTRTIPSSPYVTNVALPRKSDVGVSLEGKIGTVCGFGRINDIQSQPSQLLRFMKQDIVANTVCAKVYGSVNVRTTNLCLSGTGGRSTCNGKLVLKNRLK